MCTGRCTPIRSFVLAAAFMLAFPPRPLLSQELGTTGKGEVRTFVRSVEIAWSPMPADPIEIPPLPLARGTRYTLERVQLSEQRILRALADEGFGNAVVEIAAGLSPDERWVDVRFGVEPGARMVFGPVLIESEPPLTEIEILRRLTYAEGQLVSPVPLEQSVGRLQRLAIVDQVLFDARPDPVAALDGAPILGVPSGGCG
jgi:outer membrane translocation and assembly module TamA